MTIFTSFFHGHNTIVMSASTFFASLLITIGVAAQPYSVPPQDAPELASLGAFRVGVKTMTLTTPDQPDIPKIVMSGGQLMTSNRTLTVEVWYPAIAPADATAVRYAAKLPRSKDHAGKGEFSAAGIALRDAAPVVDQRFPLVLVSHGFGGWGTFMSYLTENLASKGYVVAAIDHADAPFNDGGSFALSFGSTLVHRTRDQQFVLKQLLSLAADKNDALGRTIDAAAIGIIGYSMGGYGALTTTGAGYDPMSPTFKQIPPAVMAAQTDAHAQFAESRPKNIKALVLIAPWGGQPANKAWTASSLANIKAPTLLIAGDQDDIADFKEGISYLFNELKGTTRNLLVFQNARHNTGGNPPPKEAMDDFVAREYFDEPVWRKDRINAINQHFITAFLDLNLKGMKSRAGFLDLPTVKSSDAKWPTAFGQQTGGNFATGTNDTAQYWRGFQRRWALGLEFHRKTAGQ